MNNLNDLRFNYEKIVNNVTKQGKQKHHFLTSHHKMKQQGNLKVKAFYEEFEKLELELEKDGMQSIGDLEMYLNWLGKDGFTGN